MIDQPAQHGRIAFIGLGRMGRPMACALVDAGFAVVGHDRAAIEGMPDGFSLAGSAAEAARDAQFVVTMLPDGASVRQVLLDDGAAEAMVKGGLVIDMSSSQPLATRELGAHLQALGRGLVDAPVSGGVARAQNATLTVMAGGEADDVARARPLLEAMGSRVFHCGGLGSGHAMKALNNYVSAAGLAAACEALVIGQAMGMEGETMVDVLNASTGRNNSTDVKLKPFILSGSYASGFSLALMEKDLRIARELAGGLGVTAELADYVSARWSEALEHLGAAADHTEIHRFLAARATAGAHVDE